MISKLCPSAFPLWWHVWVSKPHEPSQFCKSKLCPWRIRPIDPDWEGPAEYVLYDIICALGPVLSLACACIHSNWASLYKREQQISVGNKSLSVKRKNCKLHQSMAFPKLQITDLYKSSKSMWSNLDRSLTSPLAQVAEDGIGSTSSTMTRAGENKWEALHRRGTTMDSSQCMILASCKRLGGWCTSPPGKIMANDGKCGRRRTNCLATTGLQCLYWHVDCHFLGRLPATSLPTGFHCDLRKPLCWY